MASNVAGIETADYDVVTTERDVESLTELFKGASVVCNTVGPFSTTAPRSWRPAWPPACTTSTPPASRTG